MFTSSSESDVDRYVIIGKLLDNNLNTPWEPGAHGSVIGWGTMLQAGRSGFPMRSLEMSRKCGGLDVSQPYELPRLIIGIPLRFTLHDGKKSRWSDGIHPQVCLRNLWHILRDVLRAKYSNAYNAQTVPTAYHHFPFISLQINCLLRVIYLVFLIHTSEDNSEMGQTIRRKQGHKKRRKYIGNTKKCL
jgi:hypothetical protein